ncbi:MAG: putative DNA-binding transcriptional regulator YafY [Candidatus Promineifilaceae bacterium]|jgi:predicted DNA-binding transcriptional regulator YafY
MYYPSTRLFSLLELLQAHSHLTGTEIAEKLEVDGRTVRRYVTRLQEMGVPIETEKGRYGGYRLDQKYKLPPLVFQSDEILALTMGLMFTRRLNLAGVAAASDRAIHKIERVMPPRMVEQMTILNRVVEMEPPEQWYSLSADIVLDVSQAVHEQKTIWMRYGDRDKQGTARKIDPYALVFMIGMWYVAGYCHLRQALRTFRVDRIQELKTLSVGFQKEKPADFDANQFVDESIALTPNAWNVRILFKQTMKEVRAQIPRTTALYEQTAEGVIVSISSPDLDRMARFVLGLKGEFQILGPPEIKAALVRLAEKASRITGGMNAVS